MQVIRMWLIKKQYEQVTSTQTMLLASCAGSFANWEYVKKPTYYTTSVVDKIVMIVKLFRSDSAIYHRPLMLKG